MGVRVPTRPKLRSTWPLVAGAVAAITAGAVLFAPVASAATVFSAGFEDGSISGWSKSGGTWAVVTDGSRAAQQSKADAENARLFNAPTTLTDYTVQARVKPLSIGSNGFVGLLSRANGSTVFYRLALLPGRVELQAVQGSSVTVIGGSTRTVSNGTWYTLSITTAGSTVSGSIDGAQVASGSSSVSASGRIGFQTSYASASFDDVVVTTGGTTPPTSPTPTPTRPSATPTGPGTPTPTPPATGTPTPPPTGPPGSANGLVGFATLSGYGRTGTNGGTGGATVTVGNYAQLAAAVADDVPRIVRVSGTITGGGDAMLDVGSNKTIIGVGSTATISGFGLDVNGWGPEEVAWGGDLCDPAERDRFTPVQNVIIRNLSFRNSADDSVNVQCYSHHVWIDHNTFYPANDGSVDIKRGSDLATVSYNRYAGTDKSMLLGHSDSNAAQDTGYLRVTYHHNWFDGSNTRHPRVRFGYAHVYANYVSVDDYFIGLGVEGRIYAESNYVEGAKTITEDFGNARLTWTGSNFYDPATITRANDSGKTMEDWLRADGSVAAPPYSYSAGSASSTPPSAGAGVGGADIVP
ncbi:pectate lyase [Micromonospora sp. NBC_01699]|uniref:pectate lyase family protein n=1 Tax=Micromonospora sp. NBC_01699 TaxID=2975984 RepID=UPI002E2AEBBE|nr:LamG domain-containing protein [Micromonospora sp. NBC_01699]